MESSNRVPAEPHTSKLLCYKTRFALLTVDRVAYSGYDHPTRGYAKCAYIYSGGGSSRIYLQHYVVNVISPRSVRKILRPQALINLIPQLWRSLRLTGGLPVPKHTANYIGTYRNEAGTSNRARARLMRRHCAW